MGRYRINIPTSKKTQEITLAARIYPASDGRPRPLTLTARFDPTRPKLKRYVLVEGQMTGDDFHPYTHDVEVSVEVDGRTHRFFIFAKRHKRLPVNESLAALKEAEVRGDLIVVACGPRMGARGIRGGEIRAANAAVEKAIPCLKIPSMKTIPQYWPRKKRRMAARNI